MDKTLILKEIMKYKKLTKRVDFADLLAISPQRLAKWFERNTFDIDILSTKLPELNVNWLLTGKGEMLLNEKKEEGNKISEPTSVYKNGSANEIENLLKKIIGSVERFSSIMDKLADNNAMLVCEIVECNKRLRKEIEKCEGNDTAQKDAVHKEGVG